MSSSQTQPFHIALTKQQVVMPEKIIDMILTEKETGPIPEIYDQFKRPIYFHIDPQQTHHQEYDNAIIWVFDENDVHIDVRLSLDLFIDALRQGPGFIEDVIKEPHTNQLRNMIQSQEFLSQKTIRLV